MSVNCGARLSGAFKYLSDRPITFSRAIPSKVIRLKARGSIAPAKLICGIVAAGALLCAAAAAQNAGTTTAPDWLSSALYNPPVKIAGNLPAESGVNLTLAPFAGYMKPGSGTSSQEFSGSSGSIAFPIGQAFGLYTNFTAASLGSNGVYNVGTNFYWRDPSAGLIGALGDIGELTGSNGFHYALGGADAEGYYGRVTLFAGTGAFGLQGQSTDGFGMIGAGYYPTDNLQLSLGGYDFGGISGAQAGVEYLLPKPASSTVAITVGADGYVGNHGTSGAMARLQFLTGFDGHNNKTLIERRREDDPMTTDALLQAGVDEAVAKKLLENKVPQEVGVCRAASSPCTSTSQCCTRPRFIAGGPSGGNAADLAAVIGES